MKLKKMKIKNFCSIKNAFLEIKKITILLGEPSEKDLLLQLIYAFERLEWRLRFTQEKLNTFETKKIIPTLSLYFNSTTEIEYFCEKYKFTATYQTIKIDKMIDFTNKDYKYNEIINDTLINNYILQYLNEQKKLKNFKLKLPLKNTYLFYKSKENALFIKNEYGAFEFSKLTKAVQSLALMLLMGNFENFLDNNKTPVFQIIENPEENLHPIFQNLIMLELLRFCNYNIDNRLLFTTNSPYILGTLNNSIYAGKLSKKGYTTSHVMKKEYQILPKNIIVYEVKNGINNVMNKELNEINNSVIDECSDKINLEYEKLENIEFGLE